MMKFKHIAYHREAVMGMQKIFVIFFILCMIGIPGVMGYDKIIEYTAEGTTSWNPGAGSATSYLLPDRFRIPGVENYPDVVSMEVIETGVNSFGNTAPAYTTSTFYMKNWANTKTIGTGTAFFSSSEDGLHDRLIFYFDTWDLQGETGTATLRVTYNNANFKPFAYKANTATTYPALWSNGGTLAEALHQITFRTDYKAELSIINSSFPNVKNIIFNRQVEGINYPSTFDARNDNFTYYDNIYAASGNYNFYIDYYPTTFLVKFGSPAVLYQYQIQLNGINPDIDYIEGIPPTPTPTITQTPTPTPVPELCGYWSLAVNTSQVNMNEYVQGTLTETDPSDRYDMIDWYRVMPSGQEVLALHYVYDPGLFGLGAGWFEVTPTGTAYASSLAEALENDIQFTTAGANHLRAKIYDDVSLLPMVYHDYDLVCTLDQVVYVGGTTQASNTLGINVKECDTSAMLTGVNIGVYDYFTGQWSNKTSEYGGTTYFNVVPGHNVRVVANKTGWLNSDTDYTIPATPYPYEVCLKRPLVDIEDKSYVFFNVRDSVTLTGLFQANIQLSDGQIQNTLPSGYAGFSVNDSETYIYTVTKPGYQSFSDSFTITTDTTIPVKLVQISPTPTLTYPITTLPTVTITGTGTVTPTGTGTGVWSNTTATLSPADKTYKTTKGLDVWYNNIETLSGLLFVAAVFGAIGLISDSMSRRRRR